MLDKITIFSPGKLNIFLKVLGKRNDGFHFIRTGITFINLFDKIEIQKSNLTEVIYKGLFKPKKNKFDDCIMLKTLKFLNIYEKKFFKITVTKNIPVQGGLGSASTNAASLILGLQSLNIVEKKDPKFYVSLGADIPCFLKQKNCIATGIGEILYSQIFPKYFFLLVKPKINNSTEKMYKKLNLQVEPSNNDFYSDPSQFHEDDNGNTFEKIALCDDKNFKEIFEFLQKLEYAIFTRMTGTGSCCFTAFTSKFHALEAHKIFKSKFNKLWSVVCENNFIKHN